MSEKQEVAFHTTDLSDLRGASEITAREVLANSTFKIPLREEKSQTLNPMM